MAKNVATILGIGFLLVGVLGFVVPNLLGAHLSVAHSIVHIITGAVSLWLGLKGSLGAARAFCIAFGAVYVLLGIAGFAAGVDADPSQGVPGPHDGKLLKIVPGQLEFGTADHGIHILLGLIYLVGGLATKRVVAVAR